MSLTSLLLRISSWRANPRIVAVARILIGIDAAIAAFESFRLLRRLLEPSVIKLPYFDGFPILSPATLPIYILFWFVAALAFAIGFKTRIAGAALVCIIGYTLLLDQQTYSNHLYLLFLIVLLLTLANSGAAISLDVRRREASGKVESWAVLLLKIQVSIVYVFSALAKLTPEYLSGQVITESLKRSGYLSIPLSWRVPQAMKLLAVTAIAVELFISIGLWSRRLRLVAILAGIAFHAFIIAAIDSSRLSLGIFAIEMFALYLLFFDEPVGAMLTRSEE